MEQKTLVLSQVSVELLWEGEGEEGSVMKTMCSIQVFSSQLDVFPLLILLLWFSMFP